MSTHRSPSPEDQLNDYLDALVSERPTPPTGELDRTVPAESARELHDLASAAEARERGPLDEIWASILDATADSADVPTERKAPMLHANPLATPNGTVRPIRNTDSRPTGWMGRISQGLATAMVIALLVALVGGVYLREFGLPTGGDPTRAPGLAASPEATSDSALSCASPGYRPVVEGEVDADALAAIGMTETPLNIDGAHINVPTSTGEVVTLASTWTPLGGPMWSNPAQANAAGEATVRNIETGEEWTYPYANNWLEGLYIPPYLVMPANGNATDFRIIDTESGEETLVSEIRGGDFTYRARISQIAVDHNAASSWLHPAPAVLLFSQDEFQPVAGVRDPFADPGTNVLFLPADLEDASFARDRADAKYFHETAYSSETNQLAYATDIDGERAIVVIEPGTDDRIVLQPPDFTADALPLMFSVDGTTLVVSQPGALYTFDLDGETPSDPVFRATFDDPVMPIAHNAESMNVLLQFPDGHVAIRNALSGDLKDFSEVTVPEPDYTPSDPNLRLSFETNEYVLFDDAASTVRLIDLIQETVSPELPVLNPEEDSISASFQPAFQYNVRYPHASWSGGYAYLDDSAALQIVPTDLGEESWSVPAPGGFELAENEVARLFTNPDATCLVLQIATSTGSDFGPNAATPPTLGISSASRSEFVATWIMPIEPGAEWTKLDVQLTAWFPTFEELEPQTLPAQDFGTPVATPASTALSCGAPGYVPVVRGDVDPDVHTLLGGPPIDVTDRTVTAANGTVIAFDADTDWGVYPDTPLLISGLISGEDFRTPDAITSLITGASWDIPEEPDTLGDGLSVPFAITGSWLLAPTDETHTDWYVINTETGASRLTSSIFGVRFTEAHEALVPDLSSAGDSRSALVVFSGPDRPSPILVLPSGDPADAYALDPEHGMAGGTGVITSDGSRIAYRTLESDGTPVVRVLDGFTGEFIAEHPGPTSAIEPQVVGLAADETKVVLRDRHHVWTVDLVTGELTTVVESEETIESFEVDHTTGTALAGYATGRTDTVIWIDPATGVVKTVGSQPSLRFPNPYHGWALLQTRHDSTIEYAVLDMATGEVAAGPISIDRDASEGGTMIVGDSPVSAGVYVVRNEPGTMLVLDGPSARTFELTAPEGDTSLAGVAIEVSPNQACIVYWRVGSGSDPGTSWLAPLEPDAEWVELPFELAFWIEVPELAETQILPAQEFATPAAFVPDLQTNDDVPISFNLRDEPSTASTVVTVLPSGTPLMDLGEDAPTTDPIDGDRWLSVATEDGRTGWIRELDLESYVASATASPVATPESTGALDGVVIVEGDAEQARIEGDVAIATLGDDGLTLPPANGETVTIPNVDSVDLWTFDGQLRVSREGESSAVVDLATGEIVHEMLEFQPFSQWYGRWYMIPTDDTLTDWTISDTDTGQTRLLSEIVDLPGDEPVLPTAYSFNVMSETLVFEIQPGSAEDLRWIPSGPPIAHIVIAGSPDRIVEVQDYPTVLDRTGEPALVEASDGRVIAYETRAGDDRVVVVDTTTGKELARFGTDTVGEDPILAGFTEDQEHLAVTTDDRVLLLNWRGDGNPAFTVREGLEDIGNSLLHVAEATLYFTQGDRVMRLHMPSDKLTEIASGFVPGALSFTRHEGSDWIFFQTQDGVTLVDARSGEIVSQMKLPGALGGFPNVEELSPWWMDADGDTLIIATQGQSRTSSGVPGSIFVLSPEFPSGLEIAGPSDEYPLGNAYLSTDGTTLYVGTQGQSVTDSDLWVTPLGEEPSWARIAEGAEFQRFIPLDGADS